VHPNMGHNAVSRYLKREPESSEDTDLDVDGGTKVNHDLNVRGEEGADGDAHTRNTRFKTGEKGNKQLDNSSDQNLSIDAYLENELEADEDINEYLKAGSCNDLNVEDDTNNTANTNLRGYGNYGGNESVNINGEVGEQRCEGCDGNTGVVACIGDIAGRNFNVSCNLCNDIDEGSGGSVLAIATRHHITDSDVYGLRAKTEGVSNWSGSGSRKEAEGKDSSEDSSETHCV